MKKTLSLLAIAAATLNGAANATDDDMTSLTVSGRTQSVSVGASMATGATLINTATSGIVIFDENTVPPIEAPFDIDRGVHFQGFTLSGTLPGIGETLVLDFTKDPAMTTDFGYYLGDGSTGWDGAEYVPIDYMVINFTADYDFEKWYTDTPMTVIGKFKNNVEATGYIITNSCDQDDSASANGGLVFFNARVAAGVEAATVPEPATATLSLLALAGLAARRRRK